eukprot:6052436-Ditylum_brightwellii.AAC.1
MITFTLLFEIPNLSYNVLAESALQAYFKSFTLYRLSPRSPSPMGVTYYPPWGGTPPSKIIYVP